LFADQLFSPPNEIPAERNASEHEYASGKELKINKKRLFQANSIITQMSVVASNREGTPKGYRSTKGTQLQVGVCFVKSRTEKGLGNFGDIEYFLRFGDACAL
jgi:hypothetical protein